MEEVHAGQVELGGQRAVLGLVLIDLGLRALLFYWFLVTTRMLVGTSWPMSVVLLIVNWVPSLLLSLLVARILGVVAVAPA